MNKSFLRNVIGQNLELLLLVNNIVDITDMIYGISTNFYTFLCQKCYVGYYVINHGVYTRRSCCNKIIASKLLRQNKGYSARRVISHIKRDHLVNFYISLEKT